MPDDTAADLVRELDAWVAPDDRQDELRREYRELVRRRGVAALRRDGGPAHVTASCFVFSADLDATLLCFHRKGQFWVQTGGHLEPGDPTAADAALREACEESGLTDLTLVAGVLDLDRHDLSGRFGSCRTHWDIGFAALAGRAEVPRTSDESEQVGWFPVDALPAPLADRVESRVVRFRDQVRAVRSGRDRAST